MPERNDAAVKEQTSLAAINKLITSIGRSAVKLNESIHNAGVMCIEHANTFGDCSPAARLVDAMPKSHRRNLLINWFAEFSPITIAKNGKTDKMKAHLRGKADANKNEDGYRHWDIPGAKATPFYAMPEAEREPEVPTYEKLHENVVQFLDRAMKRAEKIEDNDGKRKAMAELSAMKAAVKAA